MSKMKTYVLMLAKTFPADHPRAGQETHFAEKYLSGQKIHTIRAIAGAKHSPNNSYSHESN